MQVPFLDILDHIPGNSEVSGYIENGHMPGEVEDISLKGKGIGKSWIGKSEVYLTDGIAAPALYLLNTQIEIDGLRSNV